MNWLKDIELITITNISDRYAEAVFSHKKLGVIVKRKEAIDKSIEEDYQLKSFMVSLVGKAFADLYGRANSIEVLDKEGNYSHTFHSFTYDKVRNEWYKGGIAKDV